MKVMTYLGYQEMPLGHPRDLGERNTQKAEMENSLPQDQENGFEHI